MSEDSQFKRGYWVLVRQRAVVVCKSKDLQEFTCCSSEDRGWQALRTQRKKAEPLFAQSGFPLYRVLDYREAEDALDSIAIIPAVEGRPPGEVRPGSRRQGLGWG